jgi:hypothetical protein
MSLHIMVGQNPKKSNVKKTTISYFIWCDVRIYFCQKKMSKHSKCKYIHKMIEMIFNPYENFNIY